MVELPMWCAEGGMIEDVFGDRRVSTHVSSTIGAESAQGSACFLNQRAQANLSFSEEGTHERRQRWAAALAQLTWERHDET